MRFFLTLLLCCVLFANLAVAAATAPPALLAATAAAVPAAEAQAWVDSVLARPPLPPAAAAPPRAPEQEQPVLATADAPRPQVVAPETAPRPEKKSGRAGKDRRNSETAVTRQAAQAPPLVAAPAPATTTAQPSSFWRTLFTPAATGEETALPPLRAGVQPAEPPKPAQEEPVRIESVLIKRFTQQEAAGPLPTSSSDTEAMLASLVELQKNIRQEIKVTRKRLKASSSEAEKVSLEEELKQLDQQLSDSVADFERIATGVEPTVFIPQEDKGFSWKDELTTLLEPTVKELKQLTARARQKTQLKEEILDLGKQAATANRAVGQLNTLIEASQDTRIKTYLRELLPAWQNMHKRIQGKLDLARLELAKLEDENGGAARSPTEYIKTFFRERGLYLFTAVLAFAGTLVLCRLLLTCSCCASCPGPGATSGRCMCASSRSSSPRSPPRPRWAASCSCSTWPRTGFCSAWRSSSCWAWPGRCARWCPNSGSRACSCSTSGRYTRANGSSTRTFPGRWRRSTCSPSCTTRPWA